MRLLPRLAGLALIALGLALATQSAAAKPDSATTVRAAKPLIDINSASRAQLKTLPGIGDAEARRIIAGRPYLTKTDLVTSKVLPAGSYVAIKRQIIAKPNNLGPAR